MSHFIRKIKNLYSTSLKKRNNDLMVFGAWWGQKFSDNPKYLFLEACNEKKNAYWITQSQSIYNDLKSLGLPVALRDSEEGIELCKKAKYYFFCTSLEDINDEYSGGAILINLVHGLPLKRFFYGNKKDKNLFSLRMKITTILKYIPYRKSYVITTSDEIAQIYSYETRTPQKHVLVLGQPRNDCFFDGSLHKRKYSHIDYDKLVAYLPTHRREGQIPISIESILELDKLNEYCQKNKILFLIKKHFYHRRECCDLSEFSNIVDCTNMDIDTQELMYNADLLITDYSSVYLDFILLDKPIIFYPYDLNDYIENDREFCFPYNDVTPGPKVKDTDELCTALSTSLFDNNTYWKKELKRVKDLYYADQNQGIVSHKILEYIMHIK